MKYGAESYTMSTCQLIGARRTCTTTRHHAIMSDQLPITLPKRILKRNRIGLSVLEISSKEAPLFSLWHLHIRQFLSPMSGEVAVLQHNLYSSRADSTTTEAMNNCHQALPSG